MDDLGAEHLSELSVSDKNVKTSVDVKSPDVVATVATSASVAQESGNIDTRAIFSGGGGGGDFVEKDDAAATKFVATPRGRYKDRAILGSQNFQEMNEEEEEVSLSSSDGKEKTDATPENVKKIDDVIQVKSAMEPTKDCVVSASNSGMGDELASDMAAGVNSRIADDDESSASSARQQCLTFTIDFGDSSARDANAAAAAKYKSMLERFQSRHRRGASMSKIEGGESPAGSDAQSPTVGRSPRAPSETPSAAPDSAGKVKMRARDRSTSRVRDASKRHSWSPRSSTAEPQQSSSQTQNHNHPKASAVPPKSPVTTTTTMTTPTTKKPKTKPAALQIPTQEPRRERQVTKPFTPRSTAMQMALQKIDFLCPQPPLDDYHHLAMNDNVSEAGTYTLDGDNYTEEQKELMNIDKTTTTSSEVSSGSHLQQRPTDLPLKNTQTPTTTTTVSSSESRRRNNVLEVNYYHDATYKPASRISYLEKIKSRVKNITAKQQQQQQQPQQIKETSPPDPDVGQFTSVTTSGVLAKQATLDSRPKLTRRSSLSTSQIDSSEYVSTEAKLKSNAGTPYNGGYTDHQKAGYRLNVFTNQTDSQILNAIESPESPLSKLSDTAVLKTAQTKNDWIQEWARNARARSVASAIKCSPTKQQQDIMSRSYNCGPGPEEDTLTDDSIVYRNKAMDRFRMGDFDYASDPNVSSHRPPKSPTKIPSPLHTIGRARSASHTRASLQNIIQDDANNTDLYLQKTAAAISNLQQSLSRKNSLKSPPSSRDSPKKVPSRHHHTNTTTTTHQYYSADEYSPQHSIEGKLLISNPLHKRTVNSLMSNSYHEQLVLDVKIPRARKNSYDAQALTVSPARRHQTPSGTKPYYGVNIDQTRQADSSIKQQHGMSPLRRSSSFSAKCKTSNGGQQKRPAATLYTPPAARHNYVGPPVGTASIKKSASSTTFRHVYSDYDDNVAYYINDEDDLIDVEYYGSSDEDLHSGLHSGNVDEDYEDYNDDVSQHVAAESVQSDVPLTNTRYNKALLMRIERSKQKVAGTGGGPGQPPLKPNLGMVACPNTPELPRRTVKSAPRSSMRQSMPRDSSLNRLGGHIPNSLASAKKQILQTANAVTPAASTNSSTSITGKQRVQPKYMDISKYKPVQGNNFLRKNESKSTLKPEIRRSPSSASMGLTRTEPTRASNRSVKSATSGRGTSAARRDASASKQKEVELAMWKRRATYDPMRAAAEDRRKKEEAKKSAQVGGQTGGVTERPSRSPYRRGEF